MTPDYPVHVLLWPDRDREAWLERAAIRQYDAGEHRAVAEAHATDEVAAARAARGVAPYQRGFEPHSALPR